MFLLSVLLAHLMCELATVNAFHDSLNFIIPPSSRQCFFEDFGATTPVKTIDTFVQSGGKANMKLQIYGPLNLEQVRTESFGGIPYVEETIDTSAMQLAETDSFLYDFQPSLAGTYAVCLDNTLAHMLPKLVQVDIYPTASKKDAVPDVVSLDSPGADRMQRIKASISRIRQEINHVQLLQHHDRHRQQLHSELNRNSHNGLVYGSIAETIVYIIISVFQIFFVRRWFLSRNVPVKSPKNWA